MAIRLENMGIAVRDLEAIETSPTLPHEIGMHRIAFQVDDIEEARA